MTNAPYAVLMAVNLILIFVVSSLLTAFGAPLSTTLFVTSCVSGMFLLQDFLL